MSTARFLVFLARKLAIVAYMVGLEETAMAVNRATAEYLEEQEAKV